MLINVVFTTPIQSRPWKSQRGQEGITHSVFFVEKGSNPLETFQGEMSLELTEDQVKTLGQDMRGAEGKLSVRAFVAIRNGIVQVRGDLDNVTKPKPKSAAA